MDVKLKMSEYAAAINAAMTAYIKKPPHKHTGDLHTAMEYAMFPGGKRLRPLVLIGSCLAAGGSLEKALPFACAMEMIHVYSLIHDDLPAMDNSDTRHGKPSCFKAFGEAAAILAGDGFLNLAYETMLEACVNDFCMENARAAHVIAEAAGVLGMIGGQMADILYEKKEADKDVLLYIHENKTSALFQAAGYAGAILGNAPEAESLRYKEAWKSAGIAFQIKDDIENETGDAAALGKPVGSDAANRKNTYVSVFGMDKARADMKEYAEAAVKTLGEVCGTDAFITKLAGLIFV
ncbi:MAG: polyprenyl synthetase family protein [Defluviitaleaceae bacterium]|nr:polyprenyl synthetase family protein [Defluviitaleaceae bacterium]MCL2836758.1 polyprenyl synthetase family protein [Defluviitaleaceae bacterium]